VLKQRKHIIYIFIIFFAAFYFLSGFIANKPGSCATVDDLTYINNDTTKQYKDGKRLFQQCAACHVLFKNFTGPDLIGFTKRGPWGDRNNILSYLNNPFKFYELNQSRYVDSLYVSTPVSHMIFLWQKEDVDNFIYYLESEEKFRKNKN
jgi:cytochrome c2